MSPDILPGLAAGASAPPTRIGPAATGPPGDAGLSALFASLLAQSGGPLAKAEGEPGKPAARASFSTLTLPIKAVSTKLDPAKLNTMKPTLPPTVGVAAETQNAMDTVPVSGPRKAKASETKPGGELPLPEARTIPSAAVPAPPVLFIAMTPMLAAAPPQKVKPSEPVAAPSVVPTRPVQAQPVSVGLPSGPPTAAPPAVAAVEGEAPTAVLKARVSVSPAVVLPIMAVSTATGVSRVAPKLPALPKTWTLPAAPDGLMPTAAAQPAAVTARPPSETVAAPAAAPTEPAAKASYAVTGQVLPVQSVVTGQVLTVPTQVVTAVADEPAPPVRADRAPASPPSGPGPRLEKTPTAFLPVPKTTDSVEKAPVGLNAPRPTMSVPDPTQGGAATAAPQTVVMAAVPVRQSHPGAVDVPPAEAGTTYSGGSGTDGPQAPASKISLKSLTASADNNTRTQQVAVKPGPQRLSPEGTSGPPERPITRVGNGGQELQEAAAPVPAQAPAATTQTLAAAPLTRPERAEVVRQVAEAVSAMPTPARPGAASQMTLQLHPKDWGQLQISVRVVPSVQTGGAQAQTVTAHVVAASPQIKAILETGSGDLRHALRQAGLHLDKLTVTVQPTEGAAKSGMTPGGHSLLNGGNGGQSQPDARPNGSGPQPGTASFASFTGSPQGGREGGQQAPSQAGAYETGDSIEEPTVVRDAPRRAASGQVDIRA